jgi:hypothetical protein
MTKNEVNAYCESNCEPKSEEELNPEKRVIEEELNLEKKVQDLELRISNLEQKKKDKPRPKLTLAAVLSMRDEPNYRPNGDVHCKEIL